MIDLVSLFGNGIFQQHQFVFLLAGNLVIQPQQIQPEIIPGRNRQLQLLNCGHLNVTPWGFEFQIGQLIFQNVQNQLGRDAIFPALGIDQLQFEFARLQHVELRGPEPWIGRILLERYQLFRLSIGVRGNQVGLGQVLVDIKRQFDTGPFDSRNTPYVLNHFFGQFGVVGKLQLRIGADHFGVVENRNLEFIRFLLGELNPVLHRLRDRADSRTEHWIVEAFIHRQTDGFTVIGDEYQHRFGRNRVSEPGEHQQAFVSFDFRVPRFDGNFKVHILDRDIRKLQGRINFNRFGVPSHQQQSKTEREQAQKPGDGRCKELPAGNQGPPIIGKTVIHDLANDVLLQVPQRFATFHPLFHGSQQNRIEIGKLLFKLVDGGMKIFANFLGRKRRDQRTEGRDENQWQPPVGHIQVPGLVQPIQRSHNQSEAKPEHGQHQHRSAKSNPFDDGQQSLIKRVVHATPPEISRLDSPPTESPAACCFRDVLAATQVSTISKISTAEISHFQSF